MSDKSNIDKKSKQASNAKQESADHTIEISSSMKLTQPDNSQQSTNDNVKVSSNSNSSNNKDSNKKTSTTKQQTQTAQKSKGAKSVDKNASPSNVTAKTPVTPLSKIAILACLLALIAIAGVCSHFYWNQLQNNERLQHLSALSLQNQQSLTKKLQAQIERMSQKQQQQLEQIRSQINEENQTKIQQLQQKLAQLTQQQPSDWLLHEAEYLIRIAARSIWLEKNTQTAISLLNDADVAIQALNDPQYLPLRQIIQQDISHLKQLPTLATDEVILTLMALEHQVSDLTLAMVKIPESSEPEQDLTLSSDIADWRENIAKSWQIFVNEFITIRRRTGSVKPLMSPEYQQNLRENLSLKIQTAIWATHQGHNDIYQQSLTDIQQWIKDYFDLENNTSKHFIDVSEQLKTAIIKAEFPHKLASLTSIRQLLSHDKKTRLLTTEQAPEPITPRNEPEEIETNKQQPNKQKKVIDNSQPQEEA